MERLTPPLDPAAWLELRPAFTFLSVFFEVVATIYVIIAIRKLYQYKQQNIKYSWRNVGQMCLVIEIIFGIGNTFLSYILTLVRENCVLFGSLVVSKVTFALTYLCTGSMDYTHLALGKSCYKLTIGLPLSALV